MTLSALSLAVTALPVASAIAAPAELSGFPAFAGGPNASAGLLVIDLDGDGPAEIIAVAGEGVTVVDTTGGVRVGFPKELATPEEKGKLAFAAAPLACDVDGDGKPEIVLAGDNGKVYAVTGRGDLVPGFPVKVEGSPRGAVACLPAASTPGAGHGAGAGAGAGTAGAGAAGGSAGASAKHAVALTTDDGLLLKIMAGDPKPTLLGKVGKGAESGVAVADVEGDGRTELVVVGGDAKLYVIDAAGKAREKLAYKMAFRAGGVPAIGDVNDDGRAEIIVGSQDFKLHAVTQEGESLPGFPVETEYRVYAGVSLGDIDGDGVPDIVAGSGDSKLYAVSGDGKAIKGFPVTLDGRVIADAAIGDLDKDGKPEIAVATQAGSLYVLTASGKSLAGFPARLGGKAEIAPAMADLDGDGLLELIAEATAGQVHVYRFKAKGKAEKAQLFWGMSGHDPEHSGRYGPCEGRFRALGYSKQTILTTDPIEVAYTFADLDGDKEADTQIRWYLDGKRVADLDNQRIVPAERQKKHERWHYTLQESGNFKAFGEAGVLTRIFTAPDIEVRNTAPGMPGIELSPQEPLTTARLEVKVVTPSPDVDGDSIQYRYTWLRDGKPQKLPLTQTTIDPKQTTKGEEWRVIVVPFDGEVEGEPASTAVVIKDTAPGAAQVRLQPEKPKADDTVQIVIVKPAPDDDGDRIIYSYRYWVNGKPLILPAASASVPPRTLRKHDTLEVEVTSWDDEMPGGQTRAQVTLDNTPPLAPAVEISPKAPRTRQELAVGVIAQPRDADHDTVELRHQWYLNGAKVDLPAVVPESTTTKGQKWRVEVTPFDGEQKGPAATAETRIENTPPRPPLLTLEHYELFTDEEVKPAIVIPAEDDDGDPVKLKYVWLLGGKPQSFPVDKSALLPSETIKGQSWELVVTPNDGEADGEPARLAFRIENAPPTAPAVKLTPMAPTVRDRVVTSIATPATDKDGDTIVYHYRWFRNGAAVPDWPLDKVALEPMQAKKGEHWRIEVRAFDGSAEGAAAIAEVRVVNHRPDAPVVAVEPGAPATNDALTCQIVKGAVDPDGDALVYRTRWVVDDKPLPWSRDSQTLPPTITRKAQVWRCEVDAFDGTATSDIAVAPRVTIVNTPPEPPSVTIAPADPSTGDDLVCGITRAAGDADFDPITYRFAWKVNGKPYLVPTSTSGSLSASSSSSSSSPPPPLKTTTATTPVPPLKPAAASATSVVSPGNVPLRPETGIVGAGEPWPQSRVPAAATERGQRWECLVTPSDGQAQGKPGVATATIRNTPPSRPKVAVQPAQPKAGELLRCEVVDASTDADGDAVRYRYGWSKDGVAQSFAPSSVSVPGRLVKEGDLWRCAVTAEDDADASQQAESRDVVVEAAAAAKP